jgi:hypothetical protein
MVLGEGWGGVGAAEAIKEGGINASIMQEETSGDEAVERHISGNLPPAGNFCRRHE